MKIEQDTPVSELKGALTSAEQHRQKWAMFNFIALKQHARLSKMEGRELEQFCVSIGMKASAATEARKMFALAQVIVEQRQL